jgi:hypothetical protein
LQPKAFLLKDISYDELGFGLLHLFGVDLLNTKCTMMNERDEWVSDPSVRKMRSIFLCMEAAQKKLIDNLDISPFDIRLRGAREAAKDLFEHAWSLASSQGLNVGEEETVRLYIHCLTWAIGKSGIKVPAGIWPDDERIRVLLQEALQ